MIQAHKLPRWNKFKIVPTQESFATWIDEVRFVEEMIENPLMLNRFKHENGYSRPSINPYGSEMIYKMLMNYAYTVLGLRGKAVKEFMFNTMKNVAQCYHEMMMEIDKKYAERENDSFYKKLCGCSRHEHNMKRAFDDWDSYGVRVCYGCEVTYEDRYKDRTYYTTYTPMMLLQSRKCLNVWEFLQSVRPQTMAQDIVIYEDELQAILDLFGDDFIEEYELSTYETKDKETDKKNKTKSRNDVGYNNWKRNVLERDENTCQLCGLTNEETILNVHHIEKYSENKELRTNVDNGITLCYKCHLMVFGKEKEYEEYFKAIINNKN